MKPPIAAFKKILLALPFVMVGYWAFSGTTKHYVQRMSPDDGKIDAYDPTKVYPHSPDWEEDIELARSKQIEADVDRIYEEHCIAHPNDRETARRIATEEIRKIPEVKRVENLGKDELEVIFRDGFRRALTPPHRH